MLNMSQHEGSNLAHGLRATSCGHRRNERRNRVRDRNCKPVGRLSLLVVEIVCGILVSVRRRRWDVAIYSRKALRGYGERRRTLNDGCILGSTASVRLLLAAVSTDHRTSTLTAT